MTNAPAERERSITVRTYKYDGSEHRRWRAVLAKRADSLLVLNAKFEESIKHPLLGEIARGTLSVEHYWLDRWYNIFRFLKPSGELQSFYCNINVPPIFHDHALSYIDLDMDVLVAPDLSFTILDEDEFAANAERYRYPMEVRTQARDALEQVVSLIQTRQFPFTDLT